MKVKYFFLLILLAGLWQGCEKSDADSLSINFTESEFKNVSNQGATLTLEIVSASSWTASSDADWCTPATKKGSGDGELRIKVDGNLYSEERTATLTIALTGGKKETVEIHQRATTGEFCYDLPVIFHVLYKDKSDELQYVSRSRLEEILEAVNKFYAGSTNSPDMNLSFHLATTDSEGNTLSTPGVEYVEWTDDYPIDFSEFMTDNTHDYVNYLWDPNEYINVMVYNFKSDESSGSVTLGISHLPYTTAGSNSLEGLTEIKYSYLELANLSFPYCVSINSLYINEQSDQTRYSTADVTVTVAHELGHYLGLYHVFAEEEDGETANTCDDTDYCDDTPTYNKTEYDAYVNMISVYNPELFTFKNLVKRTNCSGETFTSNNIMDYAISYSDRFTPDQRTRLRHVLTYSPLIPGPKKDVVKTRTRNEGRISLPIRMKE